MIVEGGVYALLKSKSAIVAVVKDRIYNPSLPQNPVYPAISFAVVSAIGTLTHDGAFGPRTDRVQISSWGVDKPAAISLFETVQAEILGFRGTIGGVVVYGVLPLAVTPMEYPEATLKIHAIHADFRIGYRTA